MIRDTDADWNDIAAKNPFFGVLANERYLDHNITQTDIDSFYESGRADIAKVVDVCTRFTNERFRPRRALDFGCGVGRLSFAMASYADEVIGVDVAVPMLDIARKQAAARGISKVEFLPTLPSGPVDWVNSLIVFQHIPPPRGYEILTQLAEMLNPGGWFSVQLTFFRDERHVAEITRDIAHYRYDGQTVELLAHRDASLGEMSMYDYDLNRLFRILFLAGVESVVAEHTDHGGCHGAWFFGQRTRG